MNLILASASPRRSEILKNNGYVFKVIPSNYEENISNSAYSDDKILNCAYKKAESVLNKADENSIIISADTVVVLKNTILGKPADKNDAMNMLSSLSNKTHFVATAVCLINTATNKVLKDFEKTEVTFKKLTENEILNYLENSKPYDKAGSYGIQDRDFNFVNNITGNTDNVIGFPIELFKKMYGLIT